ncbi:MAG: hypothetical protein ABL994_23895, partial [Verrucomicrobiales bacterium]
MPGAPLADPGVRNYRTGLLGGQARAATWVLEFVRVHHAGSASFGKSGRPSSIRTRGAGRFQDSH